MKKTIQVYCPYHAKKTLCDANIASYRGPGHSIQELFSSWVKKETIYNLTAPACGYLHGQKSGKFCRGWADHMHKILSLFVCYSTSEYKSVWKILPISLIYGYIYPQSIQKLGTEFSQALISNTLPKFVVCRYVLKV